MFFSWLKQYMPRGLYGRALLILILPVVTLQLLVSVVFIQRHFEGVTRQMTRAVAIDLSFVIETANAAATFAEARRAVDAIAGPLQMVADWPEAIPEEGLQNPWTDFTGPSVNRYLRAQVPAIEMVSLADRRQVSVAVKTIHGPLTLDFARSRVSASNPHQLLVIMVVLGGLMTAIAYLFLRNQLRPIKRMAAAAAAYGKGRITNYSPSGAVEVRAAGMAFLDMRNRLERQTQSRTMMLSGVSHDLRTPLTRLRLGLSLLDEDDAAPLVRDVEDMQHLLDAFLDFARADAGDDLVPTVPRACVEEVLEDAARMGQAVRLSEATGSDDPVPLRPLAIRRALANLVGNALRYGNQAEIGVHVTDRAVRFVVEDDGPGIPPARREEALQPFTRLDTARNQDKGSGVGLGLAIVADIARSHGGVLRLGDSEALGGLKAEVVLAR